MGNIRTRKNLKIGDLRAQIEFLLLSFVKRLQVFGSAKTSQTFLFMSSRNNKENKNFSKLKRFMD
jgi:hypothetical protein